MGIFDGEVENSYKPMPEGIYQGRVTGLEMKTSVNGNDYLNIEFTLTNNRKAWDKIMWFNETMQNIAKSKLENLGFTREERKELTPESMQDAIKSMVSDKNYDIKIGIQKDNPDYNEVKYYSIIDAKPF